MVDTFGWTGRAAELEARDVSLRAFGASREDIELVLGGDGESPSSIELIAAACKHFATRPCLATRDGLTGSRTLTYGELWARVVALSDGLVARGIVRAGGSIGICGDNSADWVVANLACLRAGIVSVPLAPSQPADEFAHVVREMKLDALVYRTDLLPGLGPALARSDPAPTLIAMDVGAAATVPSGGAMTLNEVASSGCPSEPHAPLVRDTLVSVAYTSGSTGRPKGVMLTEGRWAAGLRARLDHPPGRPIIGVVYLPLSHMSGRLAIYRTMVLGGVSHLVLRDDLPRLLEEIQRIRPTELLLVPRVSGILYQEFQRRLRGSHVDPESILAAMRYDVLGDRLCELIVGSAVTPPEVMEFLRRCFGVPVLDSYGSTEMGPVTRNGKVIDGVSVRLVDRRELGYTSADRPFPRGELAVRTRLATPGYYGNPEATAALFDSDGYILSGDIVEERGPGELVWIDRRNDVVRLAHGEFVSASHLEQLYATRCPIIDQIYVHPDPSRAYVLAVIVPDFDVLLADHSEPVEGSDLRALLRQELDRIASGAGLPGHEVPRDFIVEERRFTADNGLCTATGKPRRLALRARYTPNLQRLAAAIDARQVAASTDDGAPRERSLAEHVLHAIALTLGLDPSDLGSTERSLAAAGVDSLAAARLSALIAERCRVTLPASALLDRRMTIADVIRRIEHAAGARAPNIDFASIHGREAELAHAEDLRLERFIRADATAWARRQQIEAPPPRTVLLTGANGFLGRSLLEDLLERLPNDGRIACLVRAGAEPPRVRDPRIEVHFGDLCEPELGLPSGVFAALAARIDAIVHAGALVNHALSYADLFEPNVLGTVELMRLAVEGRPKAIHYVSSAGVAAVPHRAQPVDETSSAAELWPRRAVGARPGDLSVGYVTSKWACEILLAELHARCGVPVTVFRCGSLQAHRKDLAINQADAFTRLLRGLVTTGIAPSSFYPPGDGSTRHLEGLPVDLVSGFVAEVAMRGGRGHHTYHVTNSHAANGISLDTVVGWIETAGIRLARLPFDEWFASFRERLEAQSELDRRRSPLLLLRRWASPQRGDRAPIDNRAFRAKLRELCGVDDVPIPTESQVHDWIRALNHRA